MLWRDWPESDATWEPESLLTNCELIVQEYLEKLDQGITKKRRRKDPQTNEKQAAEDESAISAGKSGIF